MEKADEKDEWNHQTSRRRQLEAHGLIQVVGLNLDSGIVEKRYQAAARRFHIRNPILLGEELPAEDAIAIFETMFSEVQTGLAASLMDRDLSEPTPPRHPFASRKKFRLTDEQLTAYHARLDQLIQETEQLSRQNGENVGEPFDLLVAFYKPKTE